jgi:PAS domain S-box-containing protein
MLDGAFALAKGRPMRSRVTTYVAALAVLVAAVLLRWLLDPVMGQTLPLVTLFGAVAAAVWMGGYRPALLVAVLGYLACAYLFIEPRGTFGLTEARHLVGLLAYLLTCSVIIGFGEALRVSQRRFEELARQQAQLPTSTFVNLESIRQMHSVRDLTVIGFGVTLVVLVVGGVLGAVNARRLAENERSVAQSYEVIGALESLLSTVTDAETGQRGYLLALDEKYLQPYEEALMRIEAIIVRLKELTSANAAQQARLAGLEQRIALRLDDLTRTVALMRGGDRPAALAIVRGHEGQALMDNVREAVAAMQWVEDARLRQRTAESEASFRITVLSILLPAMLGVILVCSVFYLSRRNLAQRQRAADMMTEQRERLRVTLASIGDAVIITDTEGRITYLNAVAEYVTGWRQDEVAGDPLETVFRLVHEHTREAVENPARKALRDGVIVGLANHTVLIRKDGTERPIDDSAAPIRGGNGQIIGVVMVFRDTTERRQAEGRLRLIVESAPTAIVVANAEGEILLINAQGEELFGYRRDELVSQPVERLVPPRFRANHPQYRRSFLADPRSRPMGAGRDLYGLRKDGSEFPVEIGLSAIRTPEGLFVLATVVDLTERRHLEQERTVLLQREHAARTEAERTARMLRSVQTVTDAALGETSLDTLMQEALAHVRATLAGDTATILLLTDDGTHLIPVSSDGLREELVDDVRIPMGQGIAGRIALSDSGIVFADLAHEEVVSRSLRERVKSLVGVPLRVGGRLVGVVHVGASMPHRFTAEDQKLLGLIAGRLALVIERTRLLATAETARREADAANRAKDDFLATVSHELRQPLGPILGWLTILRAGKRDEATVLQALEVIERNAKLQQQLVSDLLDVSRSIAGQLRLEIQPVDLVVVIGAAIDVVRSALDAKGLRLETALDASASLVSGDPGRLQQVVWNLLSNAVRFTPRGGHVVIRLQRVDSQAELTVSDSGHGIPAAFLPHVFERFRQAERPPSGAPGGLGLGLAIVRQLVELHGGTVHAASPGEGRGATFTVKLPLLAIQPIVSRREAVPAADRRGAPPELSGVRALVVDDEPVARELLRTVLETAGALVTVAASAAEAAGVLERERPEVLISDIGMPGEDGYALIRKVRALPPEQGGVIPAVAVTAHARTEDRTRALLAGFHLHVPKPVEAAELVAAVASLLDRAGDRA